MTNFLDKVNDCFREVNTNVNQKIDCVFKKVDDLTGLRLCEFDSQNGECLKTAVKVGAVVLLLLAVAVTVYVAVHAAPVAAVGTVAGLAAKHVAVHTGLGCLAVKHVAAAHLGWLPPTPPHGGGGSGGGSAAPFLGILGGAALVGSALVAWRLNGNPAAVPPPGPAGGAPGAP